MEETITSEAALAAATWWLNSMIEPVDESSRNFFIDVLASRITENEWLPELKCDGQPSSVLLDSAMEQYAELPGVFADAGVADSIKPLLNDSYARACWRTLRDHTLTMGNS